MGLIIEEELPNGIKLNYFRIVTLTTVVNQQCVIEVAGYASQDKRGVEQAALAEAQETGEYPETDVFIYTQYISVDYDPDMSVNKAYALLKAMPEWEDAEDVIDKWAANTAYYIGDLVMYKEQEYKCKQSHTSQEGYEPDNTPALWEIYEEGGDGIEVWTQPTGSHDAYMKDDKVHYPTADDPVYISTIDYNTYAPGVYGWDLLNGD